MLADECEIFKCPLCGFVLQMLNMLSTLIKTVASVRV